MLAAPRLGAARAVPDRHPLAPVGPRGSLALVSRARRCGTRRRHRLGHAGGELVQRRWPGCRAVGGDDGAGATGTHPHDRAERVVGHRGGVAVVYVDVVEVIGGQMHHWVGTWQLVDTSSGWLLNRPNLRPTA